jgi:hypothetical protein
VVARSPLPAPVGPLTAGLFEQLRQAPHELLRLPQVDGDPLAGDDHQLALYACYELGYRGWEDVDDEWEWETTLIELRRRLEDRFERALLNGVSEVPDPPGEDVAERLNALIEADDSPSVAQFLAGRGSREQIRELLVHRSLYGLKEADPHARAIQRLSGDPKSALLEILADEYGAGRPERLHSRLYRQAMDAFGLDGTENAHAGRIPGVTLATINLMSLLGAHARWCPALIGHFALTEMTSSAANRGYARAVRRVEPESRQAADYFEEHVEADAVHDLVAAHDLAGGLAKAEPGLAERIVFGARALMFVEARFARHVLGAWQEGRSSLRMSLEPAS